MNMYSVKLNGEYDDIIESGKKKMTGEQFSRILKYRFDKDRAMNTVSFFFKKHLIENVLGVCNYNLLKTDYGKPYLMNYPNLKFNISHAGDWIVGVVSENDIGIDVEHIKKMDDLLSIAERFFAKDEYCYIKSISDKRKQLDTFFLIWTKKESLIKAVGEGLSIPLDSFNVISGSGAPAEVIEYYGSRYYIDEIQKFSENYKLSVCQKSSSIVNDKVVELSWKDLI